MTPDASEGVAAHVLRLASKRQGLLDPSRAGLKKFWTVDGISQVAVMPTFEATVPKILEEVIDFNPATLHGFFPEQAAVQEVAGFASTHPAKSVVEVVVDFAVVVAAGLIVVEVI